LFVKAVLFALLALGLHAAFAGEPAVMQSRESYEAAFRGMSMSPPWVLISIVDNETGKARPVCTTANLVLGAIHFEYGLGNSNGEWQKAVEIAVKAEDHAFRFRQPAALANIPVGYSEAELAAARSFLAPYSPDELKSRFASLYPESRLDMRGYSRDAIACALIERGLSPRTADITGQIYIQR